MRHLLSGFLFIFAAAALAGCSGVVGGKDVAAPVLSVNVITPSGTTQKGPNQITPQAGTGAYILNALNPITGVVQDVNWSLSEGNTDCSPQCGTLSAGGSPSYSASYKPPATLPNNTSAVITARLGSDPSVTFNLSVLIIPAVTVQITDKFMTANAGGTALPLVAVVANDGTGAGVTWSLTAGGTNCSPGCGTLVSPAAPTLTATYTPPATVPTGASASPTITASSVANPLILDSFMFSISPSVTVTITNKFATQNLGGPAVAVNATVTNDASSSGVTWRLTVGGADCAPACGALTFTPGTTTAMYTPPILAPSSANDSPTITAISVAQPSQRDSFTFTINVTSLLNGSYSFLLRGYDGNLQPMAMAGSFKADGSGNIAGGEFDINDGGGILSDTTPLAGQYTVTALPNGGIGGTITISNFTFPGSKIGVAFAYVVSADGTRGKLIELDGSGYLNSGAMTLQDSTALASGKIAGTFAFGLDSDAPVGGRTVEAGEFTIGPSGVTGGLADESVAGNPAPRYSASAIAASTAGQFTEPDSSGRGTLTLNVNGDLISYAYYVVNTGQFNLLQIDRGLQYGTVQAGSAYLQKSIAAADTTSVLQMTGLDAVPSAAPPYRYGTDVIIGVLAIQGLNFELTFDYNDLGNVAQGDSVAGTVTFDTTTGRGTLSSTGGYNNHFFNSTAFYQYDSGKAFIVDVDPSTCVTTACVPPLPPGQSVTNIGASGTFTAQTQEAGGYSNATLSGNMLFGSGGSAVPSIRNFEAAFQGASGFPGTLSGYGDLTSADPAVASAVNIAFSGTYNIDNPTLGHGVVMLPAGVFADGTPATNFPASFYMIAPNQFVMIAVPPLQSVQTTGESGVSFFDPQ